MKILSLILLIMCTSCHSAKKKSTINLTTVYQSEDVVWGFDFVNPEEILLTERGGKLFRYNMKTKKKELLKTPKVYANGQGGLLDVAIYRDFIYITFSEKLKNKKVVTSLARKKMNDQNFTTIFQSNAHGDDDVHFGSRLAFKDNYLFMTIGERSERDLAQSLAHHNGSIVRLHLDGSVPKDNPFVKQPKALAEIWSYGHRNPQGISFHPTNGGLYALEFGPRGGDELNLIKAKKNYGWPIITYGKEYWGPSIGSEKKEGLEQPIIYWTPSISPSGMTFYTGHRIKEWKNNLFLANLGTRHLRRLVLNDNKVIQQEKLLENIDERFRHVRTGKDGYLYFSTDSGKIFRINSL